MESLRCVVRFDDDALHWKESSAAARSLTALLYDMTVPHVLNEWCYNGRTERSRLDPVDPAGVQVVAD